MMTSLKTSAVVAIILSVYTCSSVKTATQDRHTLTQLAEDLIELRRSVVAVDDVISVSAERQLVIKELLRYFDRKTRSRLFALLDSATLAEGQPDDTAQITTYERRIVDAVWELSRKGRSSSSFTDGTDAASVDDVLARSGRGWNSTGVESTLLTSSNAACFKDYSSFVEPITNRIWNTIRSAVCAQLGLPSLLCDQLIVSLPDKPMPSWGRIMIDAMTKIPAGLLEGKLSWVGSYNLCEGYYVNYSYVANVSSSPEIREFEGRYCRLDIRLDPTLGQNLGFGVCVPDTCTNEQVVQYINQENRLLKVVLRVLNWNVQSAYCGFPSLDTNNDPPYQATAAVFIITLVLVVLATIYDGFFRKLAFRQKLSEIRDAIQTVNNGKPKDTAATKSKLKMLKRIGLWGRLELGFVAFSAYTNMRRIFTMKHKPNYIPSLDGIRYLSFAYCMWGQTYVFGPLYSETPFLAENLLWSLVNLPREVTFQPLINFHFVADSFLLISGILVTYGFLTRSQCTSRKLLPVLKSCLVFIVRRYWRLMPALMLSIMFISSTYKYTADGPLYPAQDIDSENCKINWWVNLLMVNNLVKVHEQCFGHAWFVSLAFQLYIASLVVVIPLLTKPKLGYAVLVLMWLAHIGLTAGLTAQWRHDFDFDEWYNGYLITPWCRAGPFLIGLAYGILLYHKPTAIKLHPLVITALWILSVGCIATLTFVSYDQFRDGGERWSAAGLAAFDTLSRSAWAFAVGWIAVACQWKYAGVINDLLSWKLFMPPSRLVYMTMIMHAPIIFGYVYTMRVPLHIETYKMMYLTLGNIIFTMVIGLALGLLWDYPFGVRWQKVVLYDSCFQWLRAGRHRRVVVDQLEEDFNAALSSGTGDSSLACDTASTPSTPAAFCSNPIGGIDNDDIVKEASDEGKDNSSQ